MCTRRCLYALGILAVILASGCQSAPPAEKAAAPPDPAPINALRDRFMTVFNSGDAATLEIGRAHV